MNSTCQAEVPLQAEESRQRVLEVVARSAGRIGHDLLGIAMPLRAVLECAADDGVEVATAPEACRMIERIGAGLQMLASTERMSATADIASVYETIEPLVKASLPRGVELAADLPAEKQTVRAGREAVAQLIFRCCHAAGAWSGAGSRLVVRTAASPDAGALELRFELERPGRDQPSGGLALLPRHDDPAITALGATIEARPADPGLAVVLTVPVA